MVPLIRTHIKLGAWHPVLKIVPLTNSTAITLFFAKNPLQLDPKNVYSLHQLLVVDSFR